MSTSSKDRIGLMAWHSSKGTRPPALPNGGRLIGFACAALVLAAGGMAHAVLPERVAIVYSD